MTSPTTLLPGHEIISSDTLRQYGAPVGMLVNTKGTKLPWRPCRSKPGEMLSQFDLENGFYCAPLGTTSALSTPLPEARCNCIPNSSTPRLAHEHREFCQLHPRNRLVRVLPGQMKDLPKQPEGLLWAARGTSKWISCEHAWWKMRESFLDDPIFAYALPQWSYDEALGRGEEKAPGLFGEMFSSGIIGTPQSAAPETSEPFRAAATPSTEALKDKCQQIAYELWNNNWLDKESIRDAGELIYEMLKGKQ